MVKQLTCTVHVRIITHTQRGQGALKQLSLYLKPCMYNLEVQNHEKQKQNQKNSTN